MIASAPRVMALWLELSDRFSRAYEQQPRDESLIARIYDFADWCIQAPRNQDAGHDPLTAVAVCFYESLPTHKLARDDMPRWFLCSEVAQARAIFSYLIEPEEFDDLVRHLALNASQFRGREARIRLALEALPRPTT